jgi:preprotein translocase subunit SecD
MKKPARWFNLNFVLLLPLLALTFAGCETTDPNNSAASGGKKKKDKEATIIRFHLETNRDGTGKNGPVPIYREQPIMVNVNHAPFLDTGDIVEAAVVDTMGGFAISILFDRHGTWSLDAATGSNRGRRIAIYAEFGSARWLAAPVIRNRIADGVLTFTPDADREEAERIVRGLNAVAKELKKKPGA